MQIARVSQRIVASHKHESFRGGRLFLLEVLTPQRKPTGETLVALDMVDSGVGDLVLACSEGRWAREHFGVGAPVRSTIVAVLAEIEVEVGT